MGTTSDTGRKRTTVTSVFSVRRLSLLALALVFLVFFVFVYFQRQQHNTEHLTQHNLRHVGTISTLIAERLEIFETAMGNLRYSNNPADLGSQAIHRNFGFRVNISTLATAAPSAEMPDGTMRLDRDSIEIRITPPVLYDSSRRRPTTLLIRSTFAELLDLQEISEDSYDAILVTDPSGETVYFSSAPRSLGITRIDSLLVRGRMRAFAAAAVVTNAGQLSIAGKSYECYIQPMKDFRICGLLATDTFESKAQALPGDTIVVALIVLALLLLAAPLVSLHFVGPSERVRPVDMFLTIIGVVVGFAFLTLLLSDLIFLKYDHDHRQNAVIAAISDSIGTRASREFAAVDRMIAGLSGTADSLAPMSRHRMFSPGYRALPVDTAFLHYPGFEQLYWLDPSGELRALWTTTDQQYSRMPLGDREYFRKIVDGRSHWVQPHYSRGTGRFMVAYSTAASFRFDGRPADTTALVSVDFLPRSLVNIALPEGCGYMIIEKSGRVLFHSILQRSLQENLFTECDEQSLRDLVAAGASGYLRARYWEEDVRMYARPMTIHEQDWYLVVYARQRASAEQKSGTLIMSLVLYLLFFLPVLAGYTVFLFIRDRRLAWMWFQRGRTRDYAVATAGLLFASLACVIASLAVAELPYAMLIACVVPHAGLLTAFNWFDSRVYPASLYSYTGRTRLSFVTQRRIVTGMHLIVLLGYISIILANTGKLDVSGDGGQSTFPGITMTMLAVGGGILLAAVIMPLVRRRARPAIVRGTHGALPARAQKSWYVAFLSGLTLLLGIVPMFLFFRVSHDTHAIAANRVLHTALFEHMTRREERLHRAHHDRVLEVAETRIPLETHLRLDTIDLYLDRGRGAFLGPDRRQEQITMFSDSLLRVFMLPLSRSASSLRIHLHGGSYQPPLPFGQESRYYQSRPAFLSTVPPDGGTLPRLLLLVLFLAMLYNTILFGARRLFLIDVLRPAWRNEIPQEDSCMFVWTTEHEAGEFRSRCPKLFDLVIEYNDAKDWADRAARDILATADGSRRIVIDHFEFRAEDADFTRRKLELLEHLLITHGRQVCLICSVEPELYLLEGSGGPPAPDIQERWRRVLGLLPRVHPSDMRCESLPPAAAHGTAEAELLRILSDESRHACMREPCESARTLIRNGTITSQEELLTWIGTHCRPFYQALWMTCTKREQLALYHLAQDGFLSFRNRDVLQLLMQRGLVCMDPALRVFNETFRVFVRSARTHEQIRRWEAEEPASLWSRIKHPIFVTLAVIAAILLYSHPQYFDSTIAVLTAMAAAIPLLLRLRGMLSGEQSNT